jgi:hypothetical protein
MTANPPSGKKATVNRPAVKPDRASAAIACITTFLHPENPKVTQKSAQALTSLRFGGE